MATDTVIDPFSELLTPVRLEQQRRSERDSARQQERQQLRGRTRIGNEAGRAIGQAFGSIFQDTEEKKAGAVAEALTSARKDVDGREYTGPTSDIDERIELAAATVRQLRSRGLNAQADAVSQKISLLRNARLERRKLTAQTEKAQLDVAGQALANAGSVEDVRLKKGEVPGKDEFARIQTTIGALQDANTALDPMNPADAAKIDRNNELLKQNLARSRKLTEITGRTESDLSLQKGTLKKIEDEYLDLTGRLDGFRRIATQFQPQALDLKGRFKNWTFKIRDLVQSDAFSPEEKAQFADFTTFRMNTMGAVNQYIHDFTGAQMNQYEIPRLMGGLPNLDLGPVEFKARLDDTLITMEAVALRMEDMIRAGNEREALFVKRRDLDLYRDKVLQSRANAAAAARAAALLAPAAQ